MCNVEREIALVFSLLVNGDLAAHLLRRSAVECHLHACLVFSRFQRLQSEKLPLAMRSFPLIKAVQMVTAHCQLPTVLQNSNAYNKFRFNQT